MACSALLVDLDGTVWHSAVWYPNLIADATGRDVTHVVYALERKSVARVLSSFGVTRARFARLCDELAATLAIVDGVTETLAHLHQRSIRTGAVTSLPAWVATPMLAATNLAPSFDTVVDWGRTARHKPRPDPLLAALVDLGVPPTSGSWYVGDTTADGQPAAAAGLSFAWAGWSTGQTPPETAAVTLTAFADAEGLFG
jgi:phosphoglycolate phosphatase-like HAD superfamily hydrolase